MYGQNFRSVTKKMLQLRSGYTPYTVHKDIDSKKKFVIIKRMNKYCLSPFCGFPGIICAC